MQNFNYHFLPCISFEEYINKRLLQQRENIRMAFNYYKYQDQHESMKKAAIQAIIAASKLIIEIKKEMGVL